MTYFEARNEIIVTINNIRATYKREKQKFNYRKCYCLAYKRFVESVARARRVYKSSAEGYEYSHISSKLEKYKETYLKDMQTMKDWKNKLREWNRILSYYDNGVRNAAHKN